MTYFNVSPAPSTWAILEAQGYARFASGYFVSVPMLSTPLARSRVATVTPDTSPGEDLPPLELELLLAHSSYGCFSLICESEGRRYPFVFGLRWKYGLIPIAYLTYCRCVDDFVKFAVPLGRLLARRRFPVVTLNANGPIPGLVGKYVNGWPKYFKGPEPPTLSDTAYSERVMFGF